MMRSYLEHVIHSQHNTVFVDIYIDISAYSMEFIPIIMYFVLLFSQLSEGSLDENSVVDGSRITLLPRAETGLLVRFNF